MEQIYTIPVNEAFEACAASETASCPFCALYNKYERDEIDLILGASMMEPDIRKKTNELGFCRTHFDLMLAYSKRLPLALILESHLTEVRSKVRSGSYCSKIFRAEAGSMLASRPPRSGSMMMTARPFSWA